MYPRTGIKKDASKVDPIVLVEWNRPLEKHGTLLVALDEAGRQWAKGVELGEAKGKVLVDDVEVQAQPSYYHLELSQVFIDSRLRLRFVPRGPN